MFIDSSVTSSLPPSNGVGGGVELRSIDISPPRVKPAWRDLEGPCSPANLV
jgi:hypothetical protein